MAVVTRDVNNGYNSIKYNGDVLPHGIMIPKMNFTDEDPVSPPCSPRPEGEVEYRPRIIFHSTYERFLIIYRQPKWWKTEFKKDMEKRQNIQSKYIFKKNKLNRKLYKQKR